MSALNVNSVVTSRLCTGCGTCEAACPHDALEIIYDETKGLYRPQINEGLCVLCGSCMKNCPGNKADIPIQENMPEGCTFHTLIGSFYGIWRAWACNDDVRHSGSSGGLVTQTLLFMLETGMIDGAIVTKMNPQAPLETLTYIARHPSDLMESQKSKYCPSPLNRLLKSIIREELDWGHLAFVGLPHHVRGLRLLQDHYAKLKDTIPYVISIFTTHVPERRATEFLLYKQRIHPKDVCHIEYRSGAIPGHLHLILKDGTERWVNHLHWTYWGHTFAHFFFPMRDWISFDKVALLADFSMGDNWQNMRDHYGCSSVITRNQDAEEIFRRMIEKGYIEATPMTDTELSRDQNLTDKCNVGIRITVLRLLGRKIPEYGDRPNKRWKDLPGALRSAFRLLICEHRIPLPFMDVIIHLDYRLTRIPVLLRKGMTLLIRGLSSFLPIPTAASTRHHKYKIVLLGGYGYRDIGDEAMPHGIRMNLRALLNDDIDIVMVSPDPSNTMMCHQEKAINDVRGLGLKSGASVKEVLLFLCTTTIFLMGAIAQRFHIHLKLWKSAREVLDEIASADMVFNVGGGNLNSVMPQELYKKCTLYLSANLLRKSVIISGQTIGPFTRRIDSWYARLALNKVHMITFRDKDASFLRLQEIGVRKPLMIDAADDAMTIPLIDPEEAKAFFQKETGWTYNERKSNLIIAMNLKASLKWFKGNEEIKNNDGSATLSKEIELMAQLADQLCQTYNASIYFVPTDYTETSDDRNFHSKIVSKMVFSSRARCIEGEYADIVLKGLIGLADVAIGARYHFLVFAASQHVPFVGIASGVYQQTKLKGLADLCDLPSSFIDSDMDNTTIDKIWPQVVNIVNNRESIRNKLNFVVPKLKTLSLIGVKEAAKILKGKTVSIGLGSNI